MTSARSVNVWGPVVIIGGLLWASGCGNQTGGTPQASAPQPKPSMTASTPPTATSVAQAPAVPESQVVARVNKTVITREEYKRRLEQIPADRRPKTPEEHKAFLDQLVTEELIVQDAAARGLERNPDVQRTLQDVRRQLLLQEFSTNLLSQVEPTQQEINAFYDTNKPLFKEPERLRLRQIVTGSEEAAKAVLVQLLQGADFQQLAREQSTSATKTQGGDMGYIVRAQDQQLFAQLGKTLDGKTLAEPLEKAAFVLDVGGISGVIKAPEGFVVFKCEERKAERILPLTDVTDLVKTILVNQKSANRIQSYVTELRSKAQITVTSQPLP